MSNDLFYSRDRKNVCWLLLQEFGKTNDCSIWQIHIQVHPYRGLQNNKMGLPSLKNMEGFFSIVKLRFTKRLFMIKEQTGQSYIYYINV